MNTIINLTQHQPTQEQIEAGVVNLRGDLLPTLQFALNFQTWYDHNTLHDHALDIRQLLWENSTAQTGQKVMIGGMPSFMPVLEKILKAGGFRVLYAKTDRVSVDQPQADGTVLKVSVFKHVGFYEAE